MPRTDLQSGRHPDHRSAAYLKTCAPNDPLVVASELISDAHALQDAGRYADAEELLAHAERLLDREARR